MENTPIKILRSNESFDKTLQGQLAKNFADKFPEIIKENLNNIKKRQEKIQVFESELYSEDFIKNIRKYNVDLSAVQKRDLDGTYIISVLSHFQKERLPEGYAYKGGAARALLFRSLHIDDNAVPRDIDIIRISQEGYWGQPPFIYDIIYLCQG